MPAAFLHPPLKCTAGSGTISAFCACSTCALLASSSSFSSLFLAYPPICPAVVEKAASQLSGLRQPGTAVTAAAALGGLGFVALNFHTTLQFLGVVSASHRAQAASGV